MADPHSHIDAPTVRDPTLGRAGMPQLAGAACELPCRFGDYDLLEEIARGGMGVVFRAKQLDLNRTVAVKMIIDGCLADNEDVRRFQAEAESAANLDHPGIVPIYEVGQAEGRHFFSMAYVKGESLAQLLSRGPIDARRAARMLSYVTEAVEYAHAEGIIHRDLKPGNILLDENDRPRITDFGVAKHQRSDHALTSKGELLGTPNFMPPEQARGDTDEVSPASDVYSLGAILYTMLTGRPPFQAATQFDTLNQVIHEQVISPRRLNSLVPHDLETITLKCLEKQPARRYQAAGELANELQAYLDGKPISTKPPSLARRASNWFRHNMLVASMSGVTSLALVAGLFGIAWRCRYEMNRSMLLQTQVTEFESRMESVDVRESILTDIRLRLERRLLESETRRLAGLAQGLAKSDPELAVRLAVHACDMFGNDTPREDVVGVLHVLLEEHFPAQEPPELRALLTMGRQVAQRDLNEAEKERYLLQNRD